MEQEIKVTVAPGVAELNIYNQIPFKQVGRNHKLDTIDAIAELVKFRGTQAGTIIFHNEEGIGIILDDQVADRVQDKASFKFEQSDKAAEWGAILNKNLTQKQFIDFLKIREPNEIVESDDLLGKVQFIQFATLINGDFGYEDKNNITMMIKIKDMETTAKIPQQITVNIPLVYGSTEIIDMEVQLDLERPTNENQKPVFKLTCPKFNRYWVEAVGYEVSRLKKLLPGYQIIAGNI